MTTLTGLPIMTIDVEAAQINKITYETSKVIDICNTTGGNILVNTVNEFENGTHFIIPEGGSYNGFYIGTPAGAVLYIKAEAAGKVSVVCTRY